MKASDARKIHTLTSNIKHLPSILSKRPHPTLTPFPTYGVDSLPLSSIQDFIPATWASLSCVHSSASIRLSASAYCYFHSLMVFLPLKKTPDFTSSTRYYTPFLYHPLQQNSLNPSTFASPKSLFKGHLNQATLTILLKLTTCLPQSQVISTTLTNLSYHIIYLFLPFLLYCLCRLV